MSGIKTLSVKEKINLLYKATCPGEPDLTEQQIFLLCDIGRAVGTQDTKEDK
ncbi:MAG: hypothetical protein JJE17_01765 [Peptostreptococcaceae bacterium]|nr:hypothetical protein [Peptostreptococcaceae bacterium]